MIRSEAIPGVAFGTEADGDARSDMVARTTISNALGIPTTWATVSQVHGARVVSVTQPGNQGDADGLITDRSGLPVAVATADCLPVAIVGHRSTALVHAGWRGVAKGVIAEALVAMAEMGDAPVAATIGPHIGSCCYEVGDEVIAAVGGYGATTRWGTTSVDLASAVTDQLDGLAVERIDICTMDDDRFASFRRNGTNTRQVAIAWRA
jgi:hypothetical protein